MKAPAATAAAAAGPCELDDATQASILALDATLAGLDHYAKLGVERGAEKKVIKRAYFAFVSKYHPDRFFGKRLGPLHAALDRVFQAVTEAHDTLVDHARRAHYDARLPRISVKTPAVSDKPPRRNSKALPAQPGSTPPRKMSKAAMRAASRKMAAVGRLAGDVAGPESAEPAPPEAGSVKPPSVKPEAPKKDDERLKRLVANAREIKAHARVEMFVRAAEEAFAAGDVIGAANNYRLALEHREDQYIRNKLDDVEVLARVARFDRSVARARAAERDKKWADAAMHFERALDAKRDAAIAERAAHAIHASGGDLDRALELAEEAVTMRGNNAEYRVTLARILLALDEPERAKEEIDEALEIAPKDAHAKDLAKLIAKTLKG